MNRVVEVECVKNELRALNRKWKWNDCRIFNEGTTQKRPMVSSAKSHIMGSVEPCGKCSRTNHITSKCCIGTNKCMYCGSTVELIVAWPRRLKAIEKGLTKPLAPSYQVPPALKPVTVGRAYMISKKEVLNSGITVTSALFFNSTFFGVLFDLGATHSFIST